MARGLTQAQKKRVQIKLGPQYTQQPLQLSLIVNLFILFFVLISLNLTQPEIPLFHSLPEAEQQLVPKIWLLLLPGLSLLINIIHIGIVNLTKHIDSLMIKLYAWGGLVLQVLLLLVTLRNILIVTKL
jgi:hypothetical protein